MPGALTPPFSLRALGEIAIRCRDRAAMERFYGETLGLPVLSRLDEGITFFSLGESFGGHTAVLALFEPDADWRRGFSDRADLPETGQPSSLHHLALAMAWEEQEAAMAWLDAQGLPVSVTAFDGPGWRGVFTRDPDGNTVELVAGDPSRRRGRD